MFDDGYAFTIHPWFQATGSTGFHIYIAARAYAAELGLSSIPVKAMTTLVPTIPRPAFADAVKALIAAGAFVRLEDAIEVVTVPGSHVQAISQDPVSDSGDDRRRRLAKARKERWKERQRNAVERSGNAPGTFQRSSTPSTSSGSDSSTEPIEKTEVIPEVRKGVRGKPLDQGTLLERSGNADGTPAERSGNGHANGRIDALVQTWNDHCGKLPKIRVVTSNRRAAYGKALQAHPDLADWARIATWLQTQDWAMGGSKDHPNWFATLDYLAKPGKLAAALEKADALDAGLKPTRTGTAAGRTEVTGGKYAHLSG